MAHSCPICDSLCHCGGDIDDVQFDGTTEQDNCRHCPYGFDGDDDDDDDIDYNDDWVNDEYGDRCPHDKTYTTPEGMVHCSYCGDFLINETKKIGN